MPFHATLYHMEKASGKKDLRELLFPFRGTWHMPWIIERYLRGVRSGMTAARVANACLALSEMSLGVRRVHSLPFVLRIEPCNVCSLRCPLCACGNGSDPRKKGFIDVEDYSRIIRENPQAIIVRLDGMGEPMLHPRIFDLIRIAKASGMSTVLHSNFYAPLCDCSKDLLDSGLDRIVISIDGSTQETYEKYRVGGSLKVVLQRLRRLVEARRASTARKKLIIEVQMVDFPFNRHEQAAVRALTRELGADRFQLTEADRTTKAARIDSRRPRRCPWLWTVLTVGWDLEYHSCTNAWSYAWPRLGLRDVAARELWNHPLVREARGYNLDKRSAVIAEDEQCKCSRCYEMVVVPLRGDYSNE
jgi:hypothetical protein